MKPVTLFRMGLLLPYGLWIVCTGIVAILSLTGMALSETVNTLVMPIFFYAFGVILWLVPYTVLAIGLWIWSRNKTTESLRVVALVAPWLLGMLMMLEVFLVSLPTNGLNQVVNDFTSQSLAVGVFSLVFGYACVGIAFVIYAILRNRSMIIEEILPAI